MKKIRNYERRILAGEASMGASVLAFILFFSTGCYVLAFPFYLAITLLAYFVVSNMCALKNYQHELAEERDREMLSARQRNRSKVIELPKVC